MGCDSSASSRCSTPVRRNAAGQNQIQQMRGNLDQITTSLERLRSAGSAAMSAENQRRSVLTGRCAQNNCGPAYANAARGPANFSTICSATTQARRRRRPWTKSGTFRTVCVRTCRRAYFPVSSPPIRRASRMTRRPEGAVPGNGGVAVCLSQSGEDINPGGLDQRQPYSSLPNASNSAPSSPVLRLQGRWQHGPTH